MDDQLNDLADQFARLNLSKIHSIECQFCHDGTFFQPKHLTFTTEVAKYAHMESAHSMCRPCKMYFNGEGFRQLHWETAPEHLHDYCRSHKKLIECSKDQSVKEQWKKHIEAEHFPCGDSCEKIFDTDRELTIHRINEHWRSVCPFCRAFFKSSDALRWNVHMDSKHYWCKTCVLAFSSETERKYHYVTSSEHRLTYCDICDRHYEDAASLIQHQFAMHDCGDFGNCDEEPEDHNKRFNQQGHSWRNNQRGRPGISDHGGFERRRYQEAQGPRFNEAEPECRYSTDGQPYRPRQYGQDWRHNNRRDWSNPTAKGEDGACEEPEDPWGHWQEFYENERAPPDSETQNHQKRPSKDKTDSSKSNPWRERHPRGENYKNEQHSNEQRNNEQYRNDYKNGQRSRDPPSRPLKPKGLFPDHYVTLKVSRDISQEVLEKAAKKRRIEIHPDRFARLTNLTYEERTKKEAEAKEVGRAADILSNADSRRKYDRQLHEWEGL